MGDAQKPKASKPDAEEVHKVEDLKKDGIEIKVTPDAEKLNWKLNTAPTTIDEVAALKKPLCKPLVKKADVVFAMGSIVTARNTKGVTIKDVLDAIHKQYKKRSDDELPEPYLIGFYLDEDDEVPMFHAALGKEGAPASKKSKKKEAAGEA